MDISLSPVVVIGLVVLIVVAVNGGLILSMRRGGSHRQIEMLRRAARAARHPWAEQEKDMTELRERVSQLETDRNDSDE